MRALRPKLQWIRLMPWRQPPSEDTEGPSVVLITDEGQEIVLQRPGTFGQAERTARRMQAELEGDGPQEFAHRYGIRLC